MNFLNPGLLGSREFFRAEFANPIDRNGNSQQAAQLRKMVYPFMMRRTKQQVATDLPDKTETVLWCEMGKEQRAAYDSYRKYYRDTLLSKIDTDGINKASIQVLEGLMRLRQLCDHPHMVKDPLITTDESVKIEELMRELKENTGSNKSLVFSQFTEMLGHLRESFEREGIKYCYLDGSTPIEKRNEQVERFQNSDEEKVFLISLKAGGVGLNLTAADYVYIVDPWWNPAAEQQAIDRTHRIGQNKKIFAYKMVCKDTIEEKILKLQDRKKSLANELISEDAAFMKKLTRDDVAFLLE
jgi:non-specific serine/threonine protein kinase